MLCPSAFNSLFLFCFTVHAQVETEWDYWGSEVHSKNMTEVLSLDTMKHLYIENSDQVNDSCEGMKTLSIDLHKL